MSQRLAERVARLARLIQARQGVVHVRLDTPWRTPAAPKSPRPVKRKAPK
jgi:hypothetical protein